MLSKIAEQPMLQYIANIMKNNRFVKMKTVKRTRIVKLIYFENNKLKSQSNNVLSSSYNTLIN